MSKNKSYIIETVLSSSKEYGSGSVDGAIKTTQAPFGRRPYMARFRKSCVPYMAGPTTALGYGLRNCDPTFTPPSPTDETYFYTQFIQTTNSSGNTPLHVGSVYLEARTYTTFGVMVNELNYEADGNVYVGFKRFTDTSRLTTLSSSGGSAYQSVTSSDVVVSTADWYDIYISSSSPEGSDTTSSIRGFYYEY